MKLLSLMIISFFSVTAFANIELKNLNPESKFSNEVTKDSTKNFSNDLLDLKSSDGKGQHRDRHRDGRRPGRGSVYCDYYQDTKVTGYSIYRRRDDADIGNAVFKIEDNCYEAAHVANQARNGIVCSKFSNGNSGVYHSVYRIRDNKDLGKATIGKFEDCQNAVKYSRRDSFCSTYVQNGSAYWSPYSIQTGEDIGTKLYGSLFRCIDAL